MLLGFEVKVGGVFTLPNPKLLMHFFSFFYIDTRVLAYVQGGNGLWNGAACPSLTFVKYLANAWEGCGGEVGLGWNDAPHGGCTWMSSAPIQAVRRNFCARATGWPGRPGRDRPCGGCSIRCTDWLNGHSLMSGRGEFLLNQLFIWRRKNVDL